MCARVYGFPHRPRVFEKKKKFDGKCVPAHNIPFDFKKSDERSEESVRFYARLPSE